MGRSCIQPTQPFGFRNASGGRHATAKCIALREDCRCPYRTRTRAHGAGPVRSGQRGLSLSGADSEATTVCPGWLGKQPLKRACAIGLLWLAGSHPSIRSAPCIAAPLPRMGCTPASCGRLPVTVRLRLGQMNHGRRAGRSGHIYGNVYDGAAFRHATMNAALVSLAGHTNGIGTTFWPPTAARLAPASARRSIAAGAGTSTPPRRLRVVATMT